jgi:hypothetical protein
MKPYWKPLLFFVAFFALLVASQLSSPKPINWTPTFSGTDKNPLGTYILLSRLSDLFPNQNLTINSRSLYDILYLSADYRADLHLSNTASQASCYNIILINQHLDLDSLDARTLLQLLLLAIVPFWRLHHLGNCSKIHFGLTPATFSHSLFLILAEKTA